MTLATYSDLETAVANWLARAGDSVITSNVADFITLCESRIAYGSGDPMSPDQTLYTRPLRTRAMETEVQILVPTYVAAATVGGTANAITLTNTTPISGYTAGNGYTFTATAANSGATTVNVDGKGALSVVSGSALNALAGGEIVNGASYNLYDDGTGSHLILMPGRAHAPLPSNYLAARSSFLDLSPIRELDLLPDEEMRRRYKWQQTGTPKAFSINGDAIIFGPNPDQLYYFQFLYYKKFGALSTAVNWLMTNKPDVYLWGTLLEAKIYLNDAQGAANFLRLYKGATDGLQAADNSDRYSGQSLVIRSDVTPPCDG